MKRALPVFALALLLAGAVHADQFLVNGDFEQPLDVGWTDSVESSAGSFAFTHTDTLGQPTPGSAAKVYKYLARYASLRQTVDVPSADLTVSFDARLKIGGGSSTCWPVASVWIRYADANGNALGNTRFCRSSVYSTWANSDTVHLIEIADTTGAWNSYSLNLAEEIATNLPGINPADVAKVTVDLFSYDNGTWSGGWAEVSADNVSLNLTGIEEGRSAIKVGDRTLSAYPNPFVANTSIACAPAASGKTQCSVYDAAGSLVRTLTASRSGRAALDGAGLKPGVYVLKAGDQSTRLVKVAR